MIIDGNLPYSDGSGGGRSNSALENIGVSGAIGAGFMGAGAASSIAGAVAGAVAGAAIFGGTPLVVYGVFKGLQWGYRKMRD